MKKFKSIRNIEDLVETINIIHIECHQLIFESFNQYFTNASNIGIFCHSDEEYSNLLILKDKLTLPSENPNQKYFRLIKPIYINNSKHISHHYKYLYIRKPDTSEYGQHHGDIDFYTSEEEFSLLLQKVKDGEIKNAVISEQTGVGAMIELKSPDTNSIAYLSTKVMTENIRIRH